MAWTVDDAKQWVEERGGVDGGGLEALEMNIINGSFGAERMPVASAYLRRARDDQAQRKRQDERDAHESVVQAATKARLRNENAAREREQELRRQELELTQRNVQAAESQADSAREALKTSRVATGISVLALILSAVAILQQCTGHPA